MVQLLGTNGVQKERRHGFDYWTAYGTYDYHLKPMYWDTDAPQDSFYYVNQWGPEYEADKAIEYLNGHIDKNAAICLSRIHEPSTHRLRVGARPIQGDV